MYIPTSLWCQWSDGTPVSGAMGSYDYVTLEERQMGERTYDRGVTSGHRATGYDVAMAYMMLPNWVLRALISWHRYRGSRATTEAQVKRHLQRRHLYRSEIHRRLWLS